MFQLQRLQNPDSENTPHHSARTEPATFALSQRLVGEFNN